MRSILLTLLLLLAVQFTFAQWNSTGDSNRGTQWYSSGGALGYSIRTASGGGWSWQFVDGSNNTYFHVQYPTGNVGIGTTSPRGKFDIDGPGDIYLSDDINNGTAQRLYLPGDIHVSPWSGTNISYIHARRSTGSGTVALRFRTSYNGNTVEPMHIEGNGNVGIGTNSPNAKLTIGSYTGTMTSTNGIALGGDQNTIEFLNSNYGNGFGAKLYGLDQGNGLTSFRLAVRGNSSTWTDALFVHAGTNGAGGGNLGYIGIGTTSPTSKLDVSDANSDLSILKLRNLAWACNQRTAIEFWNGGNKNFATSRITSQMDGCGAGGEALLFETQTAGATSPSVKLTIKNDGNVGIGTTNPTQKLTVKGTVYSTEVKVDLNVPGPDYVFEETYNLPSLTEIESYIKQNKHLPEVPSAKEMEANGINLSEMNMLLLKKVEELTLHLIEQNKNNQELKGKVEELQLRVTKLETSIK